MEWINVKDELPDIGKPIFLIKKGKVKWFTIFNKYRATIGRLDSIEYKENCKIYWWHDCVRNNSFFTKDTDYFKNYIFWMPLPKPPKQ